MNDVGITTPTQLQEQQDQLNLWLYSRARASGLEPEQADRAVAAEQAVWMPQPGRQTEAYNSEADIIGYGGAAGGGKMLALYTPIPTPEGWTTMGELEVGDVVFDEQGHPTRVLAISDIDPEPESYRLIFDDGSTVDACGKHLWLTFTASDLAALTRLDPDWRARRRANRPKRIGGKKSALFSQVISERNSAQHREVKPVPTGNVKTTTQIAQTLRLPSGRSNHAVPVTKALDLPAVELPVDPYTLGAWLGDGSKGCGGFTGIDPSIWQEIEGAGYSVLHSAVSTSHHHIKGLIVGLRQIGVLQNKHIPHAYLRASQQQRLSLLQGLMDTDGHATVHGSCEFDNTNYALIQGALELVLSLGIKATVQQGVAKLNGKVVGPKWRIKFTSELPVFRLPRKLTRQNRSPRRTVQFRYVKSCERISPVPMRCIMVDSPSHLYLVGHQMVPTHNSHLALGLAITKHRRSIIFRRIMKSLSGMIEDSEKILTRKDGKKKDDFNKSLHIWNTIDGRRIEFAQLQHVQDREKYRGIPQDLFVFDEATELPEAAVRFLLGWNRTTVPGQKCRALLTFNPPMDDSGDWVTNFFGPWLDAKHVEPAKNGELRWYARVKDEDYAVKEEELRWFIPDGDTFIEVADGKPVKQGRHLVHPMRGVWVDGQPAMCKSRTFYFANLKDNPILAATGYGAQIDSLPEPLRSLLKGQFNAGKVSDPFQVIPGDWVRLANDRWNAIQASESPMPGGAQCDALGVDVARGGKAKTVIARRYGTWFAPLVKVPGRETPNGPTVAALVLNNYEAGAVVNMDAIGVGSSPYDILEASEINVIAFIAGEKSTKTDKTGKLKFRNKRAEVWWKLREALDPSNGDDLALPPDPELLADLCAPRWSLSTAGILIESKEDIYERIGRSTDCADSVVMANHISDEAQLLWA